METESLHEKQHNNNKDTERNSGYSTKRQNEENQTTGIKLWAFVRNNVGGGLYLQNGKSEVDVPHTILYTINGSGNHPTGLKEGIGREYPGYEYEIPDNHKMTVGKLVNVHTTTDACKATQSLNSLIQDAIVAAATEMKEKAGEGTKDINAYMIICCHHLYNKLW